MKNEKLNIPDSWEETEFGELLNYIQPTKYIVNNTEYNDTFKIPVLTAGKSFIKGYTNEEEGVFTDLPAIIFDDFTTASKYVTFPFKVKSSAMKILVPCCDLINLKFIFYKMQVTDVGNDTHKRYWISVYAKKKLFIPPLNEQHRITAKIEELFSALDKGTESLKKAQQQLKLYRQALLKNAFEGKLTEKWREDFVKTHDRASRLPTAEELLEAIKQERQTRYLQEFEEWKKAVKKWEGEGKQGRKPQKPKAFKEIKPLTEEELAELPKLPEGWKWAKIGVFEEHIGSGATPRGGREVYVSKGIPFIRSMNVQPNFLSLKNIVYINKNIHYAMLRSSIKEHDVLINITGASIGRSAYIPSNFGVGNVNQHVCIIRSFTKKIYYKFITFYLNSPFSQSYIKVINSGATREALTFEQIRNFPFPLITYSEQNQIVSILEEQFSVIDKLEEEIEKGLKKAELLRQSILKKAFEGKLVPQNPDDEPASELLKRIKAEKEKYLSEQKQKKKTVKTQNFASPKKKTIKL